MSNADREHLNTALLNLTCPASLDPSSSASHEWPVHVSGARVTFKIQEGPIGDNGTNGCDATEIIRYAIGLYRSFNSAHPCRENSCTITKLEEALHWQEARARDRVKRNVEGTNND
jgi:hypothetical protein